MHSLQYSLDNNFSIVFTSAYVLKHFNRNLGSLLIIISYLNDIKRGEEFNELHKMQNYTTKYNENVNGNININATANVWMHVCNVL